MTARGESLRPGHDQPIGAGATDRDHEVFFVGRLGAFILLGMLIVAGFNQRPQSSGERLQPYERLVADLPQTQRAAARLLLASVPEISALRDDLGRWPTRDDLSNELIPPFAPSPLFPHWVWSSETDRGLATYLGSTPDGAKPFPFGAVVLRFEEIARLTGPHPPVLLGDPRHLKLEDGTIVHFALWVDDRPATLAPIRPEYEGWWRLVPDR